MEDQKERKDVALARLLKKHGGTIKAMLRKKFGTTLDTDNVTEVFMRTATKVWKYPHSREERKALLATWLVAIAMRDQGER